jgi:hypothetical protein
MCIGICQRRNEDGIKTAGLQFLFLPVDFLPTLPPKALLHSSLLVVLPRGWFCFSGPEFDVLFRER